MIDKARRISVIFAAGLAGFLLGCQQDDIQRYKVPKQVPVDLGLNAERPKTRMLGAIIPHGEETWFFKLSAPEADASIYKDEFDSLLKSIHFTTQPSEPITLTTPKGWQREPGNDISYATLRPEAKDHPVEVTVTRLPGSDVYLNVKRWRDQLGLPPIAKSDLPKVTTELKIDGATATVVDFLGYRSGKMAPFAGRRTPPAKASQPEAARPEVTYTKPADWIELPPDGGGFRLVGFRVAEGERSAEITIIPLAAKSGSLLENVIRWRGQIGLPAIGEEQLTRDVHQVELAGSRCPYVELLGPGLAGKGPQRLLAAVALHGDRAWYFKMLGSPELVGKQKASFETFLRSVRFEGGQ
jgi:hypothetical protein